MKLCPNCQKEEAIIHPTLGVLVCNFCKERRKQQLHQTSTPVEFTSDEIKEGRKQFSKEIIQPFRSNQPSREYIKKYGYKNIGLTKEEADKAQNVWGDLSYYEGE